MYWYLKKLGQSNNAKLRLKSNKKIGKAVKDGRKSPVSVFFVWTQVNPKTPTSNVNLSIVSFK